MYGTRARPWQAIEHLCRLKLNKLEVLGLADVASDLGSLKGGMRFRELDQACRSEVSPGLRCPYPWRIAP
jgi:hypothetical protein